MITPQRLLCSLVPLLLSACASQVDPDASNDDDLHRRRPDLSTGTTPADMATSPSPDLASSDPSPDLASSGPTPTPGPGSDADPAGIFDGNGGFNAQNYQAMAAKYGTAAMIPFRFGHDASYYNPGGVNAPTLWERPTTFWKNPTNEWEYKYYSLGSPIADPGLYSSNAAQVVYVTDPAVADSKPGVDQISTLQIDHQMVAVAPQLPWVYNGWGVGNGHPDVNLVPSIFNDTQKAQLAAVGGMPAQPVDANRAYGATNYNAEALLVFQNGTLATGGHNTATNAYFYRPFPANLTPTAVAITNNGEFALITLWDTQNLKAKLAVVALGGAQPAGTFWNYEWTEVYPGFRNYSLWTFMKLLGYIDLPGIIAPTAVETGGDFVFGPGGDFPNNAQPGEFALTDQSHWQCLKSGECKDKYDQHGFALVASRYEKKVLVVDLTPLFQKIKHGMFDDWNTFRQNVANVGMNDDQWPYTFAHAPDETPKVVATLGFDKQVTAMSASLFPENKGLIATEDGVVHVYDMDGLQTGGTGANPHELRTFQVGRNITRLAHMRHWAWADQGTCGFERTQYVAMSRGDKRVDWIDLSTNTIVRTMRDSRLVDPISVEDNANEGDETNLIDIADYGAKAVRAYRYGVEVLWVNGGASFGVGQSGNDSFEYDGSYSTPTGPFCVQIGNVT